MAGQPHARYQAFAIPWIGEEPEIDAWPLPGVVRAQPYLSAGVRPQQADEQGQDDAAVVAGFRAQRKDVRIGAGALAGGAGEKHLQDGSVRIRRSSGRAERQRDHRVVLEVAAHARQIKRIR